jgi:multiple sugar transport system permease protein
VEQSRKVSWMTYFTLSILLVFSLFPVYWMLNTSLKSNAEIISMIPTFWPKKIDFSSYAALFFEKGFLNNVKNSFIVASLVSLFSVFVSMLAAYAIARLNFKMKRVVSKGIFYSYLMPRSVMYIPLYMMAVLLGMSNSIKGLLLIYPTITIPYATWMLISYFKTIPMELEEAAIVDGCSKVGSMFKVIFPLAAPGIVSTFIFCFTLCWSEYLYALVIITNSAEKTISLGLADLIVDDIIAWGPLMGGSIITSIPVIILYILASRFLVSGMTMGGVKE